MRHPIGKNKSVQLTRVAHRRVLHAEWGNPPTPSQFDEREKPYVMLLADPVIEPKAEENTPIIR